MEKRVIVMTFDENSKAYEAFAKLKNESRLGKIEVEQLAVVENVKGEGFKILEGADLTGSDRLFAGGLIGAFVGMIGGPLGLLLGWTTGSLIGSVSDIREVEEANSAFSRTANVLTEETVGLIAIASEFSPNVLDTLIKEELGGEVVRFTYSQVEAEIERAKETERELKKEARRHWLKREKTE